MRRLAGRMVAFMRFLSPPIPHNHHRWLRSARFRGLPWVRSSRFDERRWVRSSPLTNRRSLARRSPQRRRGSACLSGCRGPRQSSVSPFARRHATFAIFPRSPGDGREVPFGDSNQLARIELAIRAGSFDCETAGVVVYVPPLRTLQEGPRWFEGCTNIARLQARRACKLRSRRATLVDESNDRDDCCGYYFGSTLEWTEGHAAPTLRKPSTAQRTDLSGRTRRSRCKPAEMSITLALIWI